MNDKDPINSSNQRNPRNPGDLSDKVIPLKPKKSGMPRNPTNTTNQTNKKNQKTHRRATLPKQPYRKVTIRRDTTVKKKKEPFSYKYVRRKIGSFWSNYWEIFVTVLLAVIFAIYVLPRFLQ